MSLEEYLGNIPHYMVTCLILTIIFELLLSLIMGIRYKKDILNIILVNIFTNPLLVTFTIWINLYMPKWYNYMLIFSEFLVVMIEGTIYQKVLIYDKKNPFILSLILNLFSFVIGSIFANELGLL